MYRPLALFATTLLALAAFGPRSVHADDVTKLVITDQKVGTGVTAEDDDTVKVNYTGWLYSAKAPDHRGAKFDSSDDNGEPLSFTLGDGEVIAGMESAVRGMKVGGKREVIMPSSMGYGRRGAGSDIPPGSALVFDIELLGVH
ncbi:FKBP-type peptidyl-prolyl cis-trans isomerase [Dyella caseinilytica]|uniref:Peptidyl-prolyl cis-trans isomerase n=1 Tax=Dyella caseinilytica TaxID=1849581 RepID=A0ABX7GPY2_9GAMM|nr:FKBP-type peptidyl-prolyl cis-trans isomerase [Dyella caseinilytica]QRN52481.1 FKBP-type peptidyl-prolyl cis-trans isomerase [Dyella caseinilytica]GGA06374.1 peptidyl-prolyl cis-trans isomerase [Dyella caseinilytica]